MATIVLKGLYYYSTGSRADQHIKDFQGSLQETGVKCSDKAKKEIV